MRPLRVQMRALGALASPVADRFLLHGSYRHAWLVALDSIQPPLRIASLSLGAIRASVALSACRSGLVLRHVARALLGDSLLTKEGLHAGQHSLLLAFPPLTVSSSGGMGVLASSVSRTVRWHYVRETLRVLWRVTRASKRMHIILVALVAMLVGYMLLASPRGLGEAAPPAPVEPAPPAVPRGQLSWLSRVSSAARSSRE